SSAGGGSGTPFNSWANYCFPLPSGAAGSNTMIRWYQDFVTDVSFDHWGLDNISISNYSGQLIWYENGSVLISGTNPPVQYPVYDTQYSVEASDSTGTYYDTIFVSVDHYGPFDISGLQSHYCPGSPADTFAISPLNTDVTGPGVSGNIFDPAAAGAGNHIIQMMLEQDVTNYYEAANVPFWTDDFSTDKGWTGYGQGGWERDSTRISSGCGGYQCPVNDHSAGNDNYIIGTFIGDCYTELDTVYWLESPTIDCSGKQNCVLSLYSCSGFGSGDTAIISVFDGTSWTDIAGQSGFLNQSVWQLAMYNVSAFADNNPDFRLRFGIGPADTISFYKGWNIDDVKILANGMVNDTTTCVYTEYFAIEVDTTGLQQDICIVTVDQALQKNRIIWEKTDPYAEVYFVYKETTYAGVYDLIGTIPATSPGEFTDTSSVPYQQSARYCLAGIDSCGNVSDMGPAHKTIHLNVSPELPQGYSLTWEHYEGFSFDTYIIYRGDSYATLDSIQSVAYGPGIFTYTDMNPPAGVIYYMIAAVKNTPCDPNTTAKSMRQQCNMACSNIRDNGYSGIPDVKPLSVNIIPNPTDGGFYINIDQAGRNVEIIIRDVKGLVIYQDQYLTSGRNFKEYIDLPLTAGVYSVQVVSEDRISVRKLVVQ
ncbi:MAG: T9SS type A sorting domain-containing protein, partial [Bacteroidota bacterium]